ncbi:cytohesin-interacting protein [Hippoglossus stenolepis]|uniref:cytohesin-interacting protein n=1 Tax=Hippoglossus stenolepis TaxID=195615 RepID=UPI00159C5835|nr:cytohesin-interacting protein [Hippoglossus stenolepis]
MRLCFADAGPPQSSHDVDFRFDTFYSWLHSGAGPHSQSCCGRTGWCFEDYSTMQSTMNSNGLQRQGSQEIVDNTHRKKRSLWSRRSLRGNNDRHRQNTSSLPRDCKPKRTNSLVDYSDPQRTTIVLEKQDNETFGFEIQTYGLQLKNISAVEMCTSVSNVQEDSAAESAGLTAGDVIVTINGVSIEGLSHQDILALIRESTNSLMMETVCGNVVKQIELEKRVNLLKQSLHEKRVELQVLTLQEKRLMRGNLNDSSFHLSTDSSLSSPTGRTHGRRFSSDSSYRSAATDDSDQVSVFGDMCSPSPCSAASTTDDSCFFSRDFHSKDSSSRFSLSSGHHHHHQHSIGRSSSSSFDGSSSSLSPSWDETRITSLFGTLPRKSRRASVRKHILKLIPGLQRSVEEDETNTQ